MKRTLQRAATALITAAVMLASLTGCPGHGPYNDERISFDFRSPHYIVRYLHIDDLTLALGNDYNFPCIMIVPTTGAEELYVDYDGKATQGEALVRFDSIARANNDVQYNQIINCTQYIGDVPTRVYDRYTAEAECLKSIDITANKDWDSVHAAGTSLADCFVFSSMNLYKFIRYGYSYYRTVNYNVLVKDLKPDDLRLTLCAGYCYSRPEYVHLCPTDNPQPGTYPVDITVTMTLTNGKTFTRTITFSGYQ